MFVQMAPLFIITLLAYFVKGLTDNVFRCLGYWWRSILNWQILKSSLLLVPAISLGMWLSAKVDLRLREEHIRQGILALPAISGSLLIIINLHA